METTKKLTDALNKIQFRAAQAHVLALALAHALDGVTVDSLGGPRVEASDGVRGLAEILDSIRADVVDLTGPSND